MNVLSLFSGIGGLDLGLERAGMTVAGQVEIDPWCRRVLAKHWPEVPRHDDVRTAAEWWGSRPAPDLVAGGFPCQPVSLAGKGLAQADSRWLWPSFASIVRQLRPRFVLVENVPGLLGRGMGDVLGDLACLGYDAEWDCVPAAFVGAPHIRNRVWLVAYAASGGRVGANDGQRQHAPPGRARRFGAADDGISGEAGREPRVLADATGTGSPDRRTAPGGRPGDARRPRPDGLGSHVADTQIFGRRPPWPLTAPETGSNAAPEHAGQRAGENPWATEPGVGRVAHGIPRRVDRLRGLGNAVVPQVAQHVGELIMEASRAVS